jgi:hypothetical protein
MVFFLSRSGSEISPPGAKDTKTRKEEYLSRRRKENFVSLALVAPPLEISEFFASSQPSFLLRNTLCGGMSQFRHTRENGYPGSRGGKNLDSRLRANDDQRE